MHPKRGDFYGDTPEIALIRGTFIGNVSTLNIYQTHVSYTYTAWWTDPPNHSNEHSPSYTYQLSSADENYYTNSCYTGCDWFTLPSPFSERSIYSKTM